MFALRTPALIACAIGVAGIGACATSAPTSPAPSPATTQTDEVFGSLIGDTTGAVQGALGAWTLTVDPATGSAEVTPVREAAATTFGQGDTYLLSARPFLNATSMKVRSIQVEVDGSVRVGMRFIHPFPVPPDLNRPATSSKRIDLHVFEAHAMLVADGTDNFFDGTVTVNHGVLMNADGFRDPGPMFDPAALGATSATAFPYVMLGDYTPATPYGNYDPGADGWTGAALLAPTGFGVLPQGSTTDFDYLLDLDNGPSTFGIVLLAKYTDPRFGSTSTEKKSNRLPDPGFPAALRYCLPQGAGDLEEIDLTVTGTIDDANPTSSVQIDGTVLDWDFPSFVVTPSQWPVDIDLSIIPETSQPTGVEVSIPDLLGSNTVSGVVGTTAAIELASILATVTNEAGYDATGTEELPGLLQIGDQQDSDDGTASGVEQFVFGEATPAPLPGAQPIVPTVRYQAFEVTIIDGVAPGGTFTLGPETDVTHPTAGWPDSTNVAWSYFDFKNNHGADPQGDLYVFYRKQAAGSGANYWFMSRSADGGDVWGNPVALPALFLSTVAPGTTLSMGASAMGSGRPIVAATDTSGNPNNLLYMDAIDNGTNSTFWFSSAYGENMGSANWRHVGITGDTVDGALGYMYALNQTTGTLQFWQLDFNDIINTTSMGPFTVQTGGADDIVMAIDLAGNLHFAYRHGPNAIYYRKVTNPGGVTPTIGGEINVSNNLFNVVNAQIFADLSNQPLVAWEEWTNGNSNEADVYIARGDALGTSFGFPVKVNGSASGAPQDTYPDILVDASGNVIVSWNEKVGAGPERIKIRALAADLLSEAAAETYLTDPLATDNATYARLNLRVVAPVRGVGIYRRDGQLQQLKSRWFTIN